MGSLMPGWDTHSDAKRILKRNKTSLTNDEIVEFWRLKQQEAQARAQNRVNSVLPDISETAAVTTASVSSDGGSKTQEVLITWKQPTATSLDWWARSTWAFLNAPPQIPDYPEQPRYRPYIPEQDVAARFRRSVSSRT